MTLYIQAQNYFIPDNYYDLNLSEDLNSLGLDEKIAKVFLKLYGLKKIPVAKNISMETMVKSAISPLLNDKKKIDYLIHTHTMPVLVRTSYSLVRNIKNMFNIENANYFSNTMTRCVSTITSLEILDCVMGEDVEKTALIFSADKVFTSEYRIMPNITITADAASGILISNKHGHSKLLSTSIHTHGEYAKGIWMSSAELSRFGSSFNLCMLNAIEDALNKANIRFNDVKFILPHNVNLYCWKLFSSYCKFPIQKIYLKNVARFAHCYGSDLVINLHDLVSDKLLSPGDYYIMAMVAVGAVYGVALFQYLGHKNHQTFTHS